jgi:membrane-associated phospholipid phosphatase
LSRTGLIIALAVALVSGLLFALFPQLDLAIAGVFYDSNSREFVLSPTGYAELVRRAAMWIAWTMAAPAIIAPTLKLIWPNKPLIIPGRAVVFLLGTILMIAIVLPNMIFKEHWGRPRPIVTREFNGSHEFKPWWDPRGDARHNGSFFSGEAATAFWTYAPAALAPPPVRPIAFVAATLFGLTTGILRMAFGAHYASDIIAAGVTAYVVVWLIHGFVYRWGPKVSARPAMPVRLGLAPRHLTDEKIDHWFGAAVRPRKSVRWLIGVVVALTIVRLVGLRFSIVDLFPDEARYWAWAQTPALGYFSKPPLIAWIIAEVSRICGNSEWCVRAASPVLYGGTAIIGYLIARQLYDERAGFWAGLCVALSTGVVFSARIISTDVPLLFFWALALLAWVKLRAEGSWRWSVVMGVALGCGLLAKYAMIYFLLGIVCASFLDSAARGMLRRGHIWFALAIAAIIFAPNLIWNATHDFITFRHTASNVVGDGLSFNPLRPVGFLASQFGVCGPVVFAVFLLSLIRYSRPQLQSSDRVMFAFALPPLVVVTLAAFFTSVKANWAAPSGLAITIPAVALLVRQQQWRWLQISVAIGLATQIVLITTDIFADRVSVPFLPNPDVYHRTMGWKATANVVRQSAVGNGARTVVGDDGNVVASLVYYLRDDPWPVLSWPIEQTPTNQFDLDRPLTAKAAEPLLYVTAFTFPDRLAEDYAVVKTLPPIDVPTGPGSVRHLFLFELSGVRHEITPLEKLVR